MAASVQDDLLRSLGKVVRALSILFWCLPLALILSMQNLLTIWLRAAGALMPVALMGAMFVALWWLGSFQPQERVWMRALDRAKFTALAMVGLSPFVYWRNQLPNELYFNAAVAVLFGTGLFFIYNLNVVLLRLTAMLPDETLRGDARLFTAFNRGLLIGILVFTGGQKLLLELTGGAPGPDAGIEPTWLQQQLGIENVPDLLRAIAVLLEAELQWTLTMLVLFPVAVTMTLLWKTKEAIFASVFRTQQP